MPGQVASRVLNQLDPLVGEWGVHATIGGQAMPAVRSEFEWLEGGAYLRQYQHLDASPAEVSVLAGAAEVPFPATSVIGLDDASGEFCMLYSDARGVFRIYQMSLHDGVWKIWRDAPGFYQRFTGHFSEDGNRITARWEGSHDGSDWELDFDLTYLRIG